MQGCRSRSVSRRCRSWGPPQMPDPVERVGRTIPWPRHGRSPRSRRLRDEPLKSRASAATVDKVFVPKADGQVLRAARGCGEGGKVDQGAALPCRPALRGCAWRHAQFMPRQAPEAPRRPRELVRRWSGAGPIDIQAADRNPDRLFAKVEPGHRPHARQRGQEILDRRGDREQTARAPASSISASASGIAGIGRARRVPGGQAWSPFAQNAERPDEARPFGGAAAAVGKP